MNFREDHTFLETLANNCWGSGVYLVDENPIVIDVRRVKALKYACMEFSNQYLSAVKAVLQGCALWSMEIWLLSSVNDQVLQQYVCNTIDVYSKYNLRLLRVSIKQDSKIIVVRYLTIHQK